MFMNVSFCNPDPEFILTSRLLIGNKNCEKNPYISHTVKRTILNMLGNV